MRCLAAFALVVTAACSGGDSNVKVSLGDGPRAPDDMAITTTQGEMMLTIRADSLRMRISDTLRAKIDSQMAKRDTGKGFGAWIARKAMGAARKGMGLEVAVPLTSIDDARVANGALVFTYKAGTRDPFHNVKANKRPMLESFKPEDAEQFAAYVRGRIGVGTPTKPAASPAPTKF